MSRTRRFEAGKRVFAKRDVQRIDALKLEFLAARLELVFQQGGQGLNARGPVGFLDDVELGQVQADELEMQFVLG